MPADLRFIKARSFRVDEAVLTGESVPVDNMIVVMEIFYLFSVRYVHGTSLTWQGILGTRAVLIGVVIVVAAQFAFTYLPPLQAIFGSRPISLGDGIVIVAIGLVFLMIVEVEKRIGHLLESGGRASCSASAP